MNLPAAMDKFQPTCNLLHNVPYASYPAFRHAKIEKPPIPRQVKRDTRYSATREIPSSRIDRRRSLSDLASVSRTISMATGKRRCAAVSESSTTAWTATRFSWKPFFFSFSIARSSRNASSCFRRSFRANP